MKNETVILCTATFLFLVIFFYIGLHHERLKKQHRMRPEISQVSRHIYPDLEDHETDFRFENISGVKHNVYFYMSSSSSTACVSRIPSLYQTCVHDDFGGLYNTCSSQHMLAAKGSTGALLTPYKDGFTDRLPIPWDLWIFRITNWSIISHLESIHFQ